MTTPEHKIKAKVNKALKELPRCWKFMPVQQGYGTPALDYLLCVNRTFVAIETKKPGGKVTPRQQRTIEAMEAAGGIVYVVDDDESLAEMVSDLKSLARTRRYL